MLSGKIAHRTTIIIINIIIFIAPCSLLADRVTSNDGHHETHVEPARFPSSSHRRHIHRLKLVTRFEALETKACFDNNSTI